MRSMRFKRLTAAICALSIAFTQTAILPISAYAADTDSTSFTQTIDDDSNDPENTSDTNGDGNNDNDGNGNGSDDDNGGDGSNNAGPSDDNGDDANNTDDTGDNDDSDDSNDADDSDGDGSDETDTDGIAVDNTHFPDDLFRGYVSNNFDTDNDCMLSESEIAAVKDVEFLDQKFENMEGIEYFTQLDTLRISDLGYIKEIDVSKNTNLHSFHAVNSDMLKRVVLPEGLAVLSIDYCPVAEMDLTSLTDLESLAVNSIDIHSFDLSNNTKLTTLDIRNTTLTNGIDISANTALKTLVLSSCGLTSVDLSANKALTNVNLSKNSLAAVDLTNCTAASVTLATHGNTMNIGVVDGEYDLKKLADYGLDASRMLHISGAKLKDSTLYDFEGDTVIYNYDTGRGEATFNLKAEKVLNNGYYVYPDYDSYINNENGVSCAAWSDVVKTMTDRNSDYYIVLRRDIAEGNITFPSTAKSITIITDKESDAKTLTIANSALTLPVNTTLSNVKIESTAANGFTVTAKQDLEISGFYSDTLTAVNGTASSKLSVKQHANTHGRYDISYAISKFGALTILGNIVFHENTDANELELISGSIPYITDSTFTVTNIKASKNAYIGYLGDTFSPITVNGNVTLADNNSPIQLIYCLDNNDLSVRKFTSGTLLINSKTADISAFTLREYCRPSENSVLVRSGSQIRIGEPTFKLSYGDKTETFSFWDDLIAYINANPYTSGSHFITVLKDADMGSFTMPQNGKYKELFLQPYYNNDEDSDLNSNKDKTYKLKFSGDIELTGDLQPRKGILFESKDNNGYKIKLNGHCFIPHDKDVLSYGLTEIYDDNKGAASSILVLAQIDATSVTIDYAINNIGNLTVGENTVFNNTVNVRELDAGTPIYIGNKAVTVQDIRFSGTDDKVIAYTTDDFVPLTITGKTDNILKFALVDSSDHSVYKKFEVGKTLLISNNIDLIDLRLADECKPSENTAFVKNGSEIKLSETKYTITSKNGGRTYSFVFWSDVLKYINGKADPTEEYNISVLNNDDIGGTFVMPKAGTYSQLTFSGFNNEIRFTGNLTLTGKTVFHNIALESNKNFTITTNYELGIVGLASSTLTSVNGSGKNDLYLYGTTFGNPDNIKFAINKFNNVNIENKVELTNALNAVNLVFGDNSTLYTGENAVTVTNIVNNGGLISYQGDFKPVSVTENIILANNSDPLKIGRPFTGLENNMTVLISKKADLSAITLIKNNVPANSVLARVGSEIKVMTQAFKVSHMNSEKKSIDDGKFALWSDVLAVINDSTADYEIELLDNANINGAFTMPKTGTFGSLMISGGVFSDHTLTFTGNIVLTGETRFYNIGLESTKNGKPANFTITANYDLYVTSLESNTLTAINGTAKSSLSLYGNDNANYPTEVKAQINGFGKVKLYGHTALTNTVKATELVLDDDSSIQILNNAVSFTNVTADGSAQIIYRNDSGDFKPMTVTGDIIGGDNSSITIAYYSGDKALRFDNNTTVLTAKIADLSKLKVSNNCVPDTQDSVEYIFVRVGSDVKVMPAAFELMQYDPTSLDPNNGVYHGKFALWSDVIATINANKNKNLRFNVEVLTDADIGGPLTMPKAGTYKQLDISSSSNENVPTVKFTGNITLTGDTYFSYIKLESQKKVKNAFEPANYTITAGNNYVLSVNGFSSDTLTAINGSAKSKLEIMNGQKAVDFAVNKFGTVQLNNDTDIEFKNTVTADVLDLKNSKKVYIGTAPMTVKNIINANGQTIYYTTRDFKPLNITGDITLTDGGSPIEMIIGSSASYYKFESGETVLTSKTVDLSKIKAADEGIPETQGSAEYTLTRVGSDVKIMPAAFKLEYYDYNAQESTIEVFTLWSDVIGRINELAKANKDNAYAVTLLADADANGALTMPKAGTFSEFSLKSEYGKIYTLKFTGNITITGSTGLNSLRLVSQKLGKNGYEPANFKITAAIKGYVNFCDVYSDTLTEVNGSKGANISFTGSTNADTPHVIDYAVNCTDFVSMGWAVEFRNTVKAKTLNLAPTATVYVGESTVSAENIQIMKGAKLVYKTKDFTPVNMTGDIVQVDDGAMFTIALADDGNIKSYQKFESGATVLTSKTADLSKIKIADESIPEKQGSAEYTLTRIGSDVKIMPAAFELSHFDTATMNHINDGTFALWSDVIAKIEENAKTDKTIGYNVFLSDDVDLNGAFTMPKAGTYEVLNICGDNHGESVLRTIHFTGNINATGKLIFQNTKLESQKIGKNGYEPSNFKLTTNYDLTFSGICSDTLTAVNGSAKSKFRIGSGVAINYSINNFGTVNTVNFIEFNNTVKTKNLFIETGMVYVGENSITAENITAMGGCIVYTMPEFTPVTVTGEIIADSSSPLVISLVDGDNKLSYQKFEPNTTVLTAKKADISNIKIADSSIPEKQGSAEYTLTRVGSDVKIMPAAFKLSHYKTKTVDDGTYALWSDVLAKIDEISKTDKECIYTIDLLSDADIGGAFTMPKAGTYKSFYIDGTRDGNMPTLKFTGNVALTGNTAFNWIRIESQKKVKDAFEPANYTITVGNDYALRLGVRSDTLTAINGSAKSTLVLLSVNSNNEDPNEVNDVNFAINKFGKLIPTIGSKFKNTVNVDTLELRGVAQKIYIGTAPVTVKNINNRKATIYYTTNDFKPLNVTGNITLEDAPLEFALVDGDDHTSYQKFESGATVLTSKTVDLSTIKVADESVPEKQVLADHTLARVGSDVKIMPAAFKLSHQNNTKVVDDGTYALWSDVLAKIAETAKTDKECIYTIDLLSDADIGGAFTMPKAGTYKRIDFDSYYNTFTLKFTGNITATGDMNFYDIKLESQKNGSPANFTITTKYDMTVSELSSDTLTAINGSTKSTIVFYAPTLGTSMVYTANYAVNNFENVDIKCTVKFNNTVKNKNLIFENAALLLTGKNSITAENIIAENTWNTSNIFYTTPDFTPVTVTGEIIETLGISLIDGDNWYSPQKFEPNTTVLTAKKADISHIEIPDAYAPGDGYTLARVGSDVKIMPAAFKLFHYDNGIVNDGNYALWSNVLAKIAETAKTNKELIYSVELLSDADIGGAFTMPKAGTYKGLELDSVDGNNYTLNFTGNVTTTGYTYFGNIRLESQKNGSPANFTISTKYNMSIDRLRSETLTAINGSSKSTIYFDSRGSEPYVADYAVNNFGNVDIRRSVKFNNTVKTRYLLLTSDSALITGKNSITTENISVANRAFIAYTTPDFTPVSVTGEKIATRSSRLEIALFDSDFTVYQKFEPNTTVLIAENADISHVKIADNSAPENQDPSGYALAKVGSDVKIMPTAFELTASNGYGYALALWSDAVNAIAENAKEGYEYLDYTVTLVEDYDIGGTFKMPAANTYGSLLFTSKGNQKNLSFTGNISLTGTTTFSNICLDPQKKVGNAMQSVPFSISAGRNKLELYNTNANIKNITSNGDVLLANVTVGTLTANNVYICKMNANGTSLTAMSGVWEGKEVPPTDVNITGNLTVRSRLTFNAPDSSLYVGGVLNAVGIYSDNSCTLAAAKQANGRNALIIGKNGFGGSKKISFVLVDPETGKTAEITEDTVLGTITGVYADNLVPSNLSLEEDDSYCIVKDNSKLIARSKTAAKDP